MAGTKDVEERLLEEARKLGRHRTKKEAVIAALREYIQRRRQLESAEAFGTFDLDGAVSGRREKTSK